MALGIPFSPVSFDGYRLIHHDRHMRWSSSSLTFCFSVVVAVVGVLSSYLFLFFLRRLVVWFLDGLICFRVRERDRERDNRVWSLVVDDQYPPVPTPYLHRSPCPASHRGILIRER